MAQRLVALNSGRVGGVLEGGAAVVLEPSGACLSHSHGDGAVHRELTRFARQRAARAARQLVRFRNQVSATPFVHEGLGFACSAVLDRRLVSLRWPSSVGAVVVDVAGRRRLRSVEGAAELSLAANLLSFQVELLTPLSAREEDLRYVRVAQTFFADESPREYRHALAVCLAAAGAGEAPPSLLAYRSESVPRSAPEEPDWGGVQERAAVEDALLTLCADAEGAPRLDPVRFEWTAAATYRFCAARGCVEVSVAADGSSLVLRHNGFFEHTLPSGEGRVYAPDGVPRVVRDGGYELLPVADHAVRLLRAQRDAAKHAHAAGPVLPEPAQAARAAARTTHARLEVFEEQHNAQGRFTFLSDGAVLVIFADRTLLRAEPGFNECTLVSGADASTLRVNTARPCHAARYVQLARAFLVWAADRSPSRPPRFEDPRATQAERVHQALASARRQLLCNQQAIDRISLLLRA
jgi:hypothetical protein